MHDSENALQKSPFRNAIQHTSIVFGILVASKLKPQQKFEK